MTVTRVYLPMRGSDVRVLRTTRRTGTPPVRAYAVTAALERNHSADRLEEELEFAALMDAATVARGLAAEGRRIVAAADVDAVVVGPPSGGAGQWPSAVDLAEAVELRRVVSFHVDEEPGGADEDLLWYDVTELDEVVRLTSSPTVS